MPKVDRHIVALRILTIALLAILLASCGVKEKKFDKSHWHDRQDFSYANRESMVKDLMQNYLRRGMTYNGLVELVGQPESYANIKPNLVGYEIMVRYGWDIDPVETKTLFIELSKDSTIVDFRLEHWKR